MRDIDEVWRHLLVEVKAELSYINELMELGATLRYRQAGEELDVVFSRKRSYSYHKTKRYEDVLEEIACRVLGTRVRLEVVMEPKDEAPGENIQA